MTPTSTDRYHRVTASDGERDAEEIAEFIRNVVDIEFPPTGTYKTGDDELAVVDDRLPVRSVAGFRVADASIVATITSAPKETTTASDSVQSGLPLDPGSWDFVVYTY